jgi:hypothetical protein
LAWIRSIWKQISAYAAHDDPLIARCNLISLVVASNQPFYPLYVYLAVSGHVLPTFFTFVSTPFFLAVPAVARRRPILGRALLPLAGMANTVLSAQVFGLASGVEIFLMPCVLIAAAFFRSSERLVALSLLGLAALIFFGLNDRYGMPVYLYSAAEYEAFVRLNAASAGMLTVFIGFVISGLLSRSIWLNTSGPGS